MCGRYSFFTPISQAELLLQVKAVPVSPPWSPHYNAAPSQWLPVITNTEPGVIQFFRWGLVPVWSKEESSAYKMINTRAESIAEKPGFRQIMKRHRCLVLSDGYYEWQALQPPGGKGKPVKQPWRLHLPGDDILLLAGLWEEWGPDRLQTFSIITCPPSPDIAHIHDRMPVILSKQDAHTWLDNNAGEATWLSLLKPAPEGLLQAYPIDTLLNRPAYDAPDIIEPLPT